MDCAAVGAKNRMWRTLVRVVKKIDQHEDMNQECVHLIIPARSVTEVIWCPRKAIPPAIFELMKVDSRYHVECNIGAHDSRDLCFDRWETE